MSIYLQDVPLAEAHARFQQALAEAGLWQVLRTENIPLDENAIGRVLAEPIWAKVSSPHYHASAMDGFAVLASTTNGASPSTPVTLLVGPSAVYLDTGDPLPSGLDAVIPIENVEALDHSGELTDAIRSPASIRIRSAVPPWSHVRPLGEDIVATQLVLPRGRVLRPVDLGAIAAAGHDEVCVSCRPRVAILPTGTELVTIGSDLKPGDILEYNSIVMAAQIRQMGGAPDRFPITADDFELICSRISEAALEHDLILLNAGSSAGAEDFSARVVQKLGTLIVHGVAVRPGHPVILGLISKVDPANPLTRTARMVPIIGVPGYPVSASLTVEIFAEPILSHWLGKSSEAWPSLPAILTRKMVSPPGDDDYIRVVVGQVRDKVLAAPLSRGAGVITSLSQADGLVVIPRGQQGVEAGQEVQVHLLHPAVDLAKTIFCIGSHDVILDLMAQYLSERGRRFVSANVGSQGGLVALRRGEAHVAGSHLLDPASGEYNLPYLRQYLPGLPIRVIAFVGRQQGMLVRPGNPCKVRGLTDLTRSEIRFINRQRGAGTRVLLDYQLDLLGIQATSIQGYNQEEYTHLGVASAVASGRADCGLGIAAAAQALGLDFIPLYQERYDLLIPLEFARSRLLSPLLELLAEPSFQQAVASLPGYDVSRMGSVIAEE